MILIIVGPTASGKTRLAEELARKRSAEIISADSRQVYKRLSIGTSKPQGAWRLIEGTHTRLYCAGGVPYHLVDFLEPDKTFSAGDFVSGAYSAIEAARKRGHNVIVAGGTGLYVRSLIDGITELPPKDECIRKDLLAFAEKHGRDALHEKLKKADPAAATAIHPNNIQRVMRALEVFEITKTPVSKLHSEGRMRRGGLSAGGEDFVIMGLQTPREELYSRINKRTIEMLKNGMIEETAELLKEFPETAPALNGVGYDRVIAFLKNKISMSELAEKTAQDTRNYAKRQMTWFNADERIKWIDARSGRAGRLFAVPRQRGKLAAEALKIWKR